MKTITLTCQTCGKCFERRLSYHRHIVEKRNITTVFCSKHCKDISERKFDIDPVPMYNSGKSMKEIAVVLNVSESAVRNRLMQQGVQFRSRAAHMSTDRNPTKGRGHSDVTKRKLSEATIKQFSDPKARDRHAELTAQQIEKGKTGKSFNRLEAKVAKKLTEQGVVFVWQYRLGRYTFDFYLPDTNTIIEVHGTFWHADPRFYGDKKLSSVQNRNVANDAKKAEFAKSKGYNLEIIWESDVK